MPTVNEILSDEYRKWDLISQSDLNLINKSPEKYKYVKSNPMEPSPEMIKGSALHTLTLEPHKFDSLFVEEPSVDRRTKKGKEIIEEFKTKHSNKVFLSAKDYEDILGMANAVKNHHEAMMYLEGCEYETAIKWTEPKTKAQCKSKLDGLKVQDEGYGYIFDLKSTHSVEYSSFQKSIATWRYHVQAAFYIDAVENGLGKQAHDYFFIAVESEKPYLVATYCLIDRYIEKGRAEYLSNLKLLLKCREEDYWPGPNDGKTLPISLPGWYK